MAFPPELIRLSIERYPNGLPIIAQLQLINPNFEIDVVVSHPFDLQTNLFTHLESPLQCEGLAIEISFSRSLNYSVRAGTAHEQIFG